MKVYTGDASQWKDWRFKMTTWLAQTNPSFESLMAKLDQSELEPQEPEEGHRLMAGPKELTTEEEWCTDQLYQILVQPCEGRALAIVRNQITQGKARGLIAWYRTFQEAEGQVETKRSEITEKVFYSGRTAVAAKDVVAAIEAWEGNLRDYKNLTGLAEGDFQAGNEKVQTLAISTIRDAVSQMSIVEVMTKREALKEKVKADITPIFRGWGIWLE